VRIRIILSSRIDFFDLLLLRVEKRSSEIANIGIRIEGL
jgi:hypothetical protein